MSVETGLQLIQPGDGPAPPACVAYYVMHPFGQGRSGQIPPFQALCGPPMASFLAQKHCTMVSYWTTRRWHPRRRTQSCPPAPAHVRLPRQARGTGHLGTTVGASEVPSIPTPWRIGETLTKSLHLERIRIGLFVDRARASNNIKVLQPDWSMVGAIHTSPLGLLRSPGGKSVRASADPTQGGGSAPGSASDQGARVLERANGLKRTFSSPNCKEFVRIVQKADRKCPFR